MRGEIGSHRNANVDEGGKRRVCGEGGRGRVDPGADLDGVGDGCGRRSGVAASGNECTRKSEGNGAAEEVHRSLFLTALEFSDAAICSV